MRRIMLAAVGFAAGVTAALGATATAGAVSPTVNLPTVNVDDNRVGLDLTHDETAALAEGPLPALIGMVVPAGRVGAGLHQDTQLYRDDLGGVHASLREVLLESVEHPNGSVTVFLNLPGSRGPRLLDIYQRWE